MPPPATTFTDARLECLPRPARVVAGEIDPGGAAHYAQRGAAYAERLARFDAWARERIASVPEPQR